MSTWKTKTLLTTLGRDPEAHEGSVNPPIHRTSTILFPSLDELEGREPAAYKGGLLYGRYGTSTVQALQDALAELEGADQAVVTASGLAAVNLALMSFLSAGDHVLIPDSVYGSTRTFCNHVLTRFGVEVQYYDPQVGGGISELMKANTKVVYTESPGSMTIEMQDVPAIAQAAHKKGAVVIGDNTWGTPLYLKPFDLGIDVSVHSASKYINGHSDLVMGVVSSRKPHSEKVWRTFTQTCASPGTDNCYLALRGLRTMAVRMEQQQKSALEVAQWLQGHPMVAKVLYPALPGDAGHELWKRDIGGGASVFTVVLAPTNRAQVAAMVDRLELLGMGYSWGGYESLVVPFQPARIRTVTKWDAQTWCLRLHIGLEDPADIIADLDAGFGRMKKAA